MSNMNKLPDEYNWPPTSEQIQNIAISQKDDFIDDSKKLNINLEEIWKEYKFSPNSLSSFKSMQDGEHYSLLEKKIDKQEINKYRFSSGKKIRTIWSDGKNQSNSTCKS